MRMAQIVKAGTPYHISYRIAGKVTPKGTSKERYDGLIALLEGLTPVLRSGHFEDEAHTATSSWIVRSPESGAEALTAKLGMPLTPGVDLLEVIEVVPGNWHQLTKETPRPKKR